ncbi:MAG: AraC family transcriptional regulator [Pseudomonadota bacterium]
METIYTQTARNEDVLLTNARTEHLTDAIHINYIDHFFEEAYANQAIGPASFCIAIFQQGSGVMGFTNNAPMPIKSGTTVVFQTPCDTEGYHKIDAGSQFSCLDLRFAPQLLQNYGFDTLSMLTPLFQANYSIRDRIMLTRPTTAGLKAIADEMIACQFTGPTRKLYLHAKALEALAVVIGTSISSGESVNARDQRRVQQAIEFINHDCAKPWTIALLAREVGLNERKLKTGFRNQVQMTVHQYLEEVRLTAACELLRNGLTISETAWTVGYANPSHFSKRFRLRFGCRPKDWIYEHV